MYTIVKKKKTAFNKAYCDRKEVGGETTHRPVVVLSTNVERKSLSAAVVLWQRRTRVTGVTTGAQIRPSVTGHWSCWTSARAGSDRCCCSPCRPQSLRIRAPCRPWIRTCDTRFSASGARSGQPCETSKARGRCATAGKSRWRSWGPSSRRTSSAERSSERTGRRRCVAKRQFRKEAEYFRKNESSSFGAWYFNFPY